MEIIQNNKIEDGRRVQPDKFTKEDLERCYIKEKKTIAEISRIYECDRRIIERRLKKYKIPIRPQGAFLVDDDGKSLNSKYNRGEITSVEYNNKKAKNKGYENRKEYLNEWVKNKGYKDINEYNNELVKNKGYKDINEYNRKMLYKRSDRLPMSENKESPAYLGVHICENKEFLSKIINIVENMPNGNPGYDVVCAKGKKIDVKCSCLIQNKRWDFHIRKNKITDYFLMISFDNREDLNVQHIWLVKSDAVIKKTTWNSKEFVINERELIKISKGNKSLKRWIKHEITDTYKLEEAQKLCDNFKKITKGD